MFTVTITAEIKTKKENQRRNGKGNKCKQFLTSIINSIHKHLCQSVFTFMHLASFIMEFTADTVKPSSSVVEK